MEKKRVEITRSDVARAALCSDTAVRKAEENGSLVMGDLEKLVDWVVRMRIKQSGFMSFADALGDPLGDLVAVGVDELHYEPDDERAEGDW